jgi:hypothetical protein
MYIKANPLASVSGFYLLKQFPVPEIWLAYWGSRFVGVGNKGHINAQSGIHNWEEGLSVLRQLENMVVNRNSYAASML